MAIPVLLPELGESVLEGTVARWLVEEGAHVERDQPLVEVTTDKVDAEVPAPATGTLRKISVREGETVAVGTELASIEPGKAVVRAPAAEESRARSPESQEAAPPAAPPPSERPQATPLARRMAAEAQVDLASVEGTGPSGRVTRSDLERHGHSARPAAAASPGDRPAFLDYQLQPGDRVLPMSPLRRLVAEHMVLSKRVSPHVGSVAEVDMGAVVRVRDAHKQAFRQAHGFGLSFLPFVVHATVRALREYPALNASVLEDAIVEKRDIHAGIAVDTGKGLVVPVVRHADRLSLAGLAQAVEDLASRARSKRLSPDELKGGSFTISNPGRDGNLYGFAIINQPQVGILRMGQIAKRAVVRSIEGEDAIVIRPVMHLALSYDHRAVDGGPANAFLHRVVELLEDGAFDL